MSVMVIGAEGHAKVKLTSYCTDGRENEETVDELIHQD
jgi:hypothetical protein